MIHYIDDFDLQGKAVFLRLDLNVPIDKETGSIRDTTRIDEAIPTIKYCLENGARLIISSHLGRPGGKPDPKFSLEPVGGYLAETLGEEVVLLDKHCDDGVHQLVRHGSGREIILLENLRFHPGEEANDEEFVHGLARLADVYINDAFGTSHRKHASVYGVPMHVPQAGAGFLIQKELKFLDRVLHEPEHPFVLVAGGAKVTDKLKAIENMMHHVDRLIVGGAMSYAFLAANGHEIGKSKCEDKGVTAAKEILALAEQIGVEVHLPVDHIVVYPEKDPNFENPETITQINIPKDAAALDIGPKTVERFKKALAGTKTLFWNGPMGLFENERYANGTQAIADAIGELKAVKVAGGGDTISAIKNLANPEDYDLLSTGGGASLKYLEGHGLPGIDILNKKEAGGAKSIEKGASERGSF